MVKSSPHRRRRKPVPTAAGWLFLCLFMVPSCSAPTRRYEFTRLMMGVETRIVIHHKNADHAEAAARRAFDRIAELDHILSDYQIDSEVNRLCDRAGGPPISVSADLFKVLSLSESLSQASDGAFDVTAGPVIRLWREARRTGVIPTQQAIDKAMSRIGWTRVRLDPATRSAALDVPGMRLDFGGIGKGYAAQEAMAVLREAGCPRSMVALAGDIVVGDPPPQEEGWLVIRDQGNVIGSERELIDVLLPEPNSNLAVETMWAAMTVSNCAISTSGDAYQFIAHDGVRYSHIVDPRTGWALRDSIPVTAIAPDGATADALATAISVLGRVEGEVLASKFPGALFDVHREPD